MRVSIAAIVVLSVTLPRVGAANPITLESAPSAAADGRTTGASADAGSGPGYSSLFDTSGDPILLLYSSNAFESAGSHDKLRGGPRAGGVVFVPTFGPSFGSWSGVSGGSWGGGSNGGSSSGSFTLLSLGTQGPSPNSDPPPNPSFGFGPGPDAGFGVVNSLSFEPCCEDETPTVPEPATMLLIGSGLLLGLKRRVRSGLASRT